MTSEQREKIERALALANNLIEGEIEHVAFERPGPVGSITLYVCPECQQTGARPFLVPHEDGCEIGFAFDIVRQACDALVEGDHESTGAVRSDVAEGVAA